ncbi:FxsA family protein [uncultured Salinisphaera sp.]|uniref:FxsA family protein n=1 Tax=uncultured Salinisphaera sp. TaxID=359372 RepID=UPI0032B28062|tara:strand:+ start:3286 stop:3786 length:501 start_codon:yes stop_codon:yes gene_type:complete
MAGRLLLLFIIVPIIELFLLIKIGGIIGLLPTIALVILTAVIGSQLVRRQGVEVMGRIRAAQARGEAPALAMVDGAALLLAGFFLLTPGFLSDALGFVLLVPKLRQRVARTLISRVVVMAPNMRGGPSFGSAGGFGQQANDDTIEGEYQRKPDPARRDSDRLSRDD